MLWNLPFLTWIKGRIISNAEHFFPEKWVYFSLIQTDPILSSLLRLLFQNKMPNCFLRFFFTFTKFSLHSVLIFPSAIWTVFYIKRGSYQLFLKMSYEKMKSLWKWTDNGCPYPVTGFGRINVNTQAFYCQLFLIADTVEKDWCNNNCLNKYSLGLQWHLVPMESFYSKISFIKDDSV